MREGEGMKSDAEEEEGKKSTRSWGGFPEGWRWRCRARGFRRLKLTGHAPLPAGAAVRKSPGEGNRAAVAPRDVGFGWPLSSSPSGLLVY